MLLGAPNRRFSSFCVIGAIAVLFGCGPAKAPQTTSVKKSDSLPNDIDALIGFAEASSFEDTRLDVLEEAADALDKAMELSRTRHSLLSKGELSFRLARICFLAVEQQKSSADKMIWITRGEAAAEQAMRELPNRVEGYYYLAVLKGRRAQSSGIGFTAMALARDVEELGLKAVSLDPGFEDGGPYRLLAMLYAHAPPWPTSIGDIDKAVEFADKAVALSNYPMNHLVRGEVLAEDDDIDGAKAEIEFVLAAPRSGRWSHEGERWRVYARQLLAKIESGD